MDLVAFWIQFALETPRKSRIVAIILSQLAGQDCRPAVRPLPRRRQTGAGRAVPRVPGHKQPHPNRHLTCSMLKFGVACPIFVTLYRTRTLVSAASRPSWRVLGGRDQTLFPFQATFRRTNTALRACLNDRAENVPVNMVSRPLIEHSTVSNYQSALVRHADLGTARGLRSSRACRSLLYCFHTQQSYCASTAQT